MVLMLVGVWPLEWCCERRCDCWRCAESWACGAAGWVEEWGGTVRLEGAEAVVAA